MSDAIKHECGVAFVRLLKPLEFYQEKYGTCLYGLQKLQVLMTKQLNRGQDGAGLGVIKLNPDFGDRYIARKRSSSKTALLDIFEEIGKQFKGYTAKELSNLSLLKKQFPYLGELYIGHLRYGTHGGNSIENIHPFLRQNNWMARNLLLAGNYNMTNVDELFQQLIDLGQQPKEKSDNVLMLEKIGHFIDEENQRLFQIFKSQGFTNVEITEKIKEEISIVNILKRSFKNIDGGYNMIGMLGHGDSFVIRDPGAIRPSFYYADDEIITVASERAAIQTAFNLQLTDIKELGAGNALIIKHDGNCSEINIIPPTEKHSCTFERIYFGKGNDADIYTERKNLGKYLAPIIMKKINNDIENTVVSYVPNTAATAYYGLVEGMQEMLVEMQTEEITKLNSPNSEQIKNILNKKIRTEKILIKDVKIRTFITNDSERNDMVGSVYDITYGSIIPNTDTIVIMDDSIVRGTTLRKSILTILDRLKPKKIILVSSSPQIRYPDCYGIDMSKLGDFAAFQAAIAIIKQRGQESKLADLYQLAKSELLKPVNEQINIVKKIYEGIGVEEISKKVCEMVKPNSLNAELEIIYQNIENLHNACPNYSGDWYFTGNYPTSGGVKVANRAFVFYMEGKSERAY